MTAKRVVAPSLEPGSTPKGPASYFPSIAKTYGRPLQEWLDIVVARLTAGETHMAVVSELKSTYAMGHGHANAIVAYAKAELAK
ncbi:DUF4287 domain-containing protein [Microbacterium neimengense]